MDEYDELKSLKITELLLVENKIDEKIRNLNIKLNKLYSVRHNIHELKGKTCKHKWIKVPQPYDRAYDVCTICNYRTC
jgi:hypothetical protein